MPAPGQPAPAGFSPSPGPALVVFLETDCPTCRLATPYLNRLAIAGARVVGYSQDPPEATAAFRDQMAVAFPLAVDTGLACSRAWDPEAVPAMFLVNADGRIEQAGIGFDKEVLNGMAAALGLPPVADAFDGAPPRKPGCGSRHREPVADSAFLPPAALPGVRGRPASRLTLAGDEDDPHEYAMRAFGDALPVVPPTAERVARMLAATALDPLEIAGRVPPCYGEATIEKIAANAVMAGCRPELMRVLVPLVRAACDERLNLHGVQATTHFAAPLIIVNGPVRGELGFASGQNVFSNVARANSTLGRALQLILLNLGGARPDGIDMSALGNPGKFSYAIAENEEASPWEPLHVERGFGADQSAVTLFAAEPPRGVSEHTARRARVVLQAIARVLATVWSYRACAAFEALVVVGPEHARTIAGDGFSKQDTREFLFENTGIPVSEYADDGGEGTRLVSQYTETIIDGVRCYRKFRAPESIHLVTAGGAAGKFSAVIGSWAAGPRGSQMVTYPL